MIRRILLAGILTFMLILAPCFQRFQARAVDIQEMGLNPLGDAYEIHSDNFGSLWVSDFGIGEIWRVNAINNAYKAFTVGGNPTDARPDNTGLVWWIDGQSINNVDTTTGDRLTWNASNSGWLYGLGIDQTGQIWITDSETAYPYVYRFSPLTREFCTYTLLDEGQGNYLNTHDAQVWFGDIVNGRLVMIEGSQMSWWSLPIGSYPKDIEIDQAGNVWYVDLILGRLGRLDPFENQLKVYPLPTGLSPVSLFTSSGKIWYTELNERSVGMLDLLTINGMTQPTTKSTVSVNPTCRTLVKATSGSVTTRTGTLTGLIDTYPTIYSSAGWKIFQMPEGSLPWGISIENDYVWVVDTGRQKLVKITPPVDNAMLKIEVTAIPETYNMAADFIVYSYNLTNSGNVTLTGPFTVTDDKAADEACPETASLAPGAFITCGASYTVTQADLDAGSVTNTASGHAMFGSSPVNSGTDSVTVNAVQSSALAMVKEANPTTFDSVGDVIGYSYTLSNTGNVTLTGPFTVTDDKATATCPATASLTPGASITCGASYTINQADLDAGSVTNTASGHAMFDGSSVHSTTVEVTVTRSVVEYKVFLPLIKR